MANNNAIKVLEDIAAGGWYIQCAQIMNVTHLAHPSVSHHIKTLIEG